MRSGTRAAIALAVATSMLFACGRDRLQAPRAAQPLDLAKIPEVPPLQVASETVPGSDGSFAVVAAQPKGVAQGNLRPTLTFSKPVIALGSVEQEKAVAAPASIDPRVEGEWRWLGSASVEFVPKAPMPLSTRFTVSVASGLRAVDGSSLAKPFSYGFETPRPEIQAVEPAGGFRWLTAGQHFTLLFNQPALDLKGHVLLKVSGEPWEVKIVKEVSVADEARAQEPARRYPRASFEERGFKNRQTRYELAPARPLPLDAEVVLSIAPGLRGVEGPLEMAAGRSWTYRTYGPMAVKKVVACWQAAHCARGPILVLTSNRADVASLRSRLKLEPPAEIDWEHVESHPPATLYGLEGPYVALPGKYRPGTAYRVSIDRGLKDEYGQEAPEARGEVKLDDLLPGFDLGGDIALLEAAGDGALPVRSENVSRLDARIWSMTPAELVRFAARTDGWDESQARGPADPPSTPIESSLDLSGPRNVTRTRPLPLRQILGGRPSALFFLAARAPEIGRRVDRVLGQITDLGVHVKLGATRGAVWVTRLSDGKPVGDAELSIYDRAGAVRWRGRTDADGVALVPGLPGISEQPKHRWQTPIVLVAATKGEDTGVTLSTWSRHFGYVSDLPLDSEGAAQAPRGLGAIVPERGVYRPGDTVHLKGLLRIRELGAIRTPGAGSKVHLRATASQGKEIFTKEVALTEFGTFAAELVLDKDVALGTVRVAAVASLKEKELSIGGSFRVEEYRAPQFKVEVHASSPHLAAGDPLAARGLARYLFGGAMADAEARWSVGRSTISFSPRGNEGFEFGSQTWWWDDREPARSSDVFATGSGRTDAMGAFAIEVGKADAPGDRTWEYTIEAEVSDVNRQRLANRAVVTVHPAAVYAGVRRRATGFAEAGQPQVLEAITATPEGQRTKGEVAIAVKRREWKEVRKKSASGSWTTSVEAVEEPAGGCGVRTSQTPGECTFTPKQAGFYIVEATATDDQGRKQVTRTAFYVVGRGWVSWQRSETDRIDLVADKTLYEVGETARVLVKSPFPEADALLTVEREGVISARRVHLAGAATALEVQLDDDSVPNVFVSVVLVRGRDPGRPVQADGDPGRPAVRVGYAQLQVAKRSKRLQVAVVPDRAELRPRERVKVDLQVSDWKGQGASAELAVWAVDEGVLRLTGYQVPDPVEAIHPIRGLAVRLAEPLVHLVMRNLYQDKGYSAGGGGGADAAGAGFRSNFKTTVLFAPEVRTDAKGRAHVEFDLPDNLTTYRIMALAVTRGDRMGKGEAQVTVAKPLLALPALPRFARVGDRFEAGVVVHSPGAKVREVEVRAEAKGVLLEGSPVVTATLDGGRPREVRFGFRVEKPGEAVLRFTVSGSGERDGVEQRIPLALPVEQEAVAIYGDTRDARREELSPPAGVRPGIGGLEVTLSSTALGGFGESMRQLAEYPYGCLEQLSSRLVPFLALRELQSKFDVRPEARAAEESHDWMLPWVGEAALSIQRTRDPDEVVRRTVRAIEALQGHDGGYRYWPGDGCSSEWTSSYAVLALGRAAELGYPVDAAGLRRGQAYLADTVAAGRCTRCWWMCRPPDDATRVFALHALARTRAPKASYYGELAARREKLPLFARALLVDAMFVGGGDRDQARKLLAELMNFAKVSPSEVHFEETDPKTYETRWSSDTRTTAIVLETLADVAPDHPFVSRLAAYLTKIRRPDGRYRNTQESAFSLLALAEVVRAKEKDAPDYTARVSLGDRVVAQEEFRKRSLDVRRAKVPMAELAPGAGRLPFAFKREGTQGVLYYGALLRYAPATMPVEPLDRGLFVQRWFEPYEGGGQVRSARPGELVRVRVRVGTPMERNYVAIDVPLPAGLEPVDTTLASTARLPQAKGEEGRRPHAEREGEGPSSGGEEGEGDDEGGEAEPSPSFAGSFWSVFNHVENRDDRVVLFADRLPPGVHVASFLARATTPGEFVLKPAHAGEMYTPEVFGRSDGGTFKVVAGAETAGR